MNSSTKKFNKNFDKIERVDQNTKEQPKSKNNQNNKNHYYKDKINFKDNDNSEDKEIPKVSRSRNKEYQNKLHQQKNNVKQDNSNLKYKNDKTNINKEIKDPETLKKYKNYVIFRKGIKDLEGNKINQTKNKQGNQNSVAKKPKFKQDKISYAKNKN